MAETFLSPVIEKLIDLLIEEGKSLKGVHKQVESLQKELEIIEPLLRDAEAKSARGHVSDAAKAWLRQLREEAERIEDVVDEYACFVEQSRRGRDGFAGSLRKAGRCAKALTTRRDLASEIRDVEESLRKLNERGVMFGLRPAEQRGSEGYNNARVDPRIGSLFVDDDEFVGVESVLAELARGLAEGPSKRTVISLVGEGGIGKTTLARKVYNDVAEKGRFDHRVWITVSQSYDVHKILKMLMDKICPTGRENVAVEEAFDILRSSLKSKRYVIVFDDVWQTEFWSDINHALPSNSNGSRIVITTRNFAVVESFNSSSGDMIVKELKTWPIRLAWKLFCKKAFPISDCPPELERLSREILSKCQGLPLAIVAVAGLLSKKDKSQVEWQRVLDNLNKEFEENRELSRVSKILLLSYHDLPYHLKPCFLYFGIFPEDFPIVGEKLCQIWIAEGFIKSREDDESLEQIAQEYLIELISRNLVSCKFKFRSDRWCKVHDLIREVILARSSDLRFCRVFNQGKSSYKEKSRRLIIYNTTENVSKASFDSKIRSVSLFNVDEVDSSFVVGLFKNCKLLKVVDFEDAPLYDLPKEVRNLFHLRYLNLKGTQVGFLPKSIEKLHNLQILDVSRNWVRELPVVINKLRKLRHLIANDLDYLNEYGVCTYIGVRTHEGIGQLEELQTLTRVEAHSDFIKELQKLRKLKCLGISAVTSEMGNTLGESIEKMGSLEKLLLSSIDQDEVLDLERIRSPPLLLRYLRLSCRLHKFPTWVSQLRDLQGLELNFSGLVDDPLKRCKDLPNLEYLRMYQAYEGDELHFEEGGFRKLKELHLRKLEGLKAVKIDRGALPLLEELGIGPFPQMTEFPRDFQRLTNLKSLRIFDMPSNFLNTLRRDGGSEYCIIQHIPSVTFSYYRGRGVI